MLGALKARVGPVNVNYRYVAEELRYLLGNSQARAIVYHSHFAPTLAEVLPDLPNLQPGPVPAGRDRRGNVRGRRPAGERHLGSM
jgi:acyl-CoA synthetase (AMP-forming)/AMP-acid ligase II